MMARKLFSRSLLPTVKGFLALEWTHGAQVTRVLSMSSFSKSKNNDCGTGTTLIATQPNCKIAKVDLLDSPHAQEMRGI
ncbi:hypothetical protein [Afipia felis]|uniref:Uncharacterized protein n=2 Tax=Afipia felis TaxID=1035 RepID=A0A380WAV7_AFIFE|nr:hypothetical protein [Afipia felis]EKS29308.1 hypothetical protein HMPREF9697_01836 [Afipia felis ATCC 53690]SUU78016.1 Uncharacterised protein [Afipia felis]SUU86081.1 Uncharacterised protein [Afipia felis]